MQTQLQILWQIQQLEQQKAQLLTARKNVSTAALRQLWQEIDSLQQAVARDSRFLVTKREECALLEAKLRQLTSQLGEVEDLLYGGKVKGLKDLESLQEKQQALHGEIEQLENRIYEYLDCCDKLEQKIAGQEQQLQAKRRQHGQEQQRVSRQIKEIDDRLAAIQQKCTLLKSQIAPTLLNKYNDLCRLRPQPVAKLINGICSGCRLAVPVQQYGLNGEDIVCCDNCGRWLLLE